MGESSDCREGVRMSGYRDGERWTNSDGSTVTVNSTNDPGAPGGYYVSQSDGGDHSTAVYNGDGTLADVPANSGWVDVPRQD